MEYMVHDGESLNQHLIIYGIYGAWWWIIKPTYNNIFGMEYMVYDGESLNQHIIINGIYDAWWWIIKPTYKTYIWNIWCMIVNH